MLNAVLLVLLLPFFFQLSIRLGHRLHSVQKSSLNKSPHLFFLILFQIPTPMLTISILLNAFTKKWDENAEESTTCFSAVWDIYLEVYTCFFFLLFPVWYTYQKRNFTSICMLFLDCIINLVCCCIVSRKKIFVFWNKVIGQPPQFIWFSTICRLRSQKKRKEIVGTVISPISVSDYKLIGYFSVRFTLESG